MKRHGFLGTLSALALASSRPSRYAAAAATPQNAKTVRALILPGGGARGSYQAGVITGLAERGEQFDIICGTSIGAINGALFAQGDVAALRDLWATIGTRDVLRPIATLQPLLRAVKALRASPRNRMGTPIGLAAGVVKFYDRGRVFARSGLFEPEPLAEYLRSLLALERVRTTYACAVTNLNLSRAESFFVRATPVQLPQAGIARFYHLDAQNNGDRALFVDAVRASLSIPLIFPPVALQPPGNVPVAEYVDGGITLYSPIGLARELGANEIVAVSIDPAGGGPPVRGMAEIAMRCLGANRVTIESTQLNDPALGPSVRSVAIVQPARPLALGTMDFDRTSALRDAFELGHADGLRGPQPLAADGAFQ